MSAFEQVARQLKASGDFQRVAHTELADVQLEGGP